MGFLGLEWKDVAVGAISSIPVVGAVAGGVVDGVWTGIETGSVKDGLIAGATTTALSAIPGGKFMSYLPAKGLGKVSAKLIGKGAGNKMVNKVPAALGKNILLRGGGKGLGRSMARSMMRGTGGMVGSAIYHPEGGDNFKKIPVRPAGRDVNDNPFRGKNPHYTLEYRNGFAQQAY